MTSALLDFSHTEKPRQIQENMIAYMRLFAGVADIVMHDDPALFWIYSGDSAPGTSILRARWPEGDPEAHIDAVFAQVGQHIDHIDWMLFPGDQPADLGQRLEARGMPGGRAGNWLWIDLTTLGAPPSTPDGFRIQPVRDHAAMAEWVAVSEAGFGGNLSRFYDAYARHGYGADAFSLHYTGYLGDTTVTSGTLLDAGGTAAVYDVSTPPAFRGRGFGGAITHFIMREIHRRGYADTWIWASDIGRSVYLKLGCRDADFGIREHGWRRDVPPPPAAPVG